MEENSKSKKGLTIIYFLLFMISLCVIAIARFLYSIGNLACFRLLSLMIFGNIIVIFANNICNSKQDEKQERRPSPKRFYMFYIGSLVVSVLLPLIPLESWPVVVFFVLLSFASDLPAGILAGAICMGIAFSLSGVGNFAYFVFYFISGVIAALLLSKLDDDFKIGFPILITEIILFSGLSIIIITSGNGLSIEPFIFTFVNCIITLLLVLFILKVYSSRILFAENDRYLELNDPECKLLSELRNSSPEEYHKTVHVVYFCDRLARRLELDVNIIKCAGLYHRVGIIGGVNTWENISMICTEQNIPKEVMTILQEFSDNNCSIKAPESAVLYMSECIVSSVIFLFRKNKDIVLDYPSLIEAIFKQRIEAGVFKDCNISIKQFEQMKKVFIEEQLYYDFLR